MDSLSHWFWQYGAHYILYLILIAVALWTSKNIMFASLHAKYNEWNYRYRIRKVRSNVEFSKTDSYKNPILKHLNLLIKTTKIGRASCRERMYISVAAVTLKKKNKKQERRTR